MTTLDVLIIGAGQAGLALGYHLQKTPLPTIKDHIVADLRVRKHPEIVSVSSHPAASLGTEAAL